jgi:hypothetical protein
MTTHPPQKNASWGVIAMLAAAQFVMVLDTIVTEYADAQIVALKAAFAAIALFALLALWYVRRLPNLAVGDEPAATAPSQEAQAV